MRRTTLGYLVVALTICAAEVSAAAEPADPNLIPEARAVLEYLRSQYGKRTLSAVNCGSRLTAAEQVHELTGRWPAIANFDLTGWNSPTWGKNYTTVIREAIESAKTWGNKGGIVSMQFHWKHPGKPNGTAWVGKHGSSPPSGPFDLAAALKPGTEPNRQFMEDLRRHADYLEVLADARVPVLWRPFHEIDGGWFWWTDKNQPENTAELWRMTFDYLVKERELHNLIWVYSVAHWFGNGRVDSLKTAKQQAPVRKRYYPGHDYVDIVGIDIYPAENIGYGSPMTETYQKGFDILNELAPGKMIALSECQAMLDPQLLVKEGPKWLYVLPWWGAKSPKGFPSDWTKRTFGHPALVTRDEIPPDVHSGAKGSQ